MYGTLILLLIHVLVEQSNKAHTVLGITSKGHKLNLCICVNLTLILMCMEALDDISHSHLRSCARISRVRICAISRLFLLLNKTRSASTTSRLLEWSVSEMFPVRLGP